MIRSALVLCLWAVVSGPFGTTQASDEQVARRQLESGRAFARQGNYTEALKDFRAVAETHAGSSVADDALLEIARYYIDVAGDVKQAAAAVDIIVKQYATSDSAPDAYLLAGRLALARSHQAADLDAAVANFERVYRLFPASRAVPRAIMLVGQAMWYAGRNDAAEANLTRAIAEYPMDASAPEAYLSLGPVLLAQGQPVQAMEELQQVRNRWPGTPAAEAALQRIALLHRLYVRASTGAAYALAPDAVGPERLQNVLALAVSGTTLYYAAESGLGVLTPGVTERPPTVPRPRGLALDRSGQVFAFDAGALRPFTGDPIAMAVPQSNGSTKALSDLKAAAQLSNGDWVIADGDDRSLQRFTSEGGYVGTFAAGKMARLAATERDVVAALDKDQKAVVIFDGAGTVTARIPLRGTGYDLQDAEDLTFDAFGHLYVLDRNAIAVFSPYAAPPAPAAAAPAGTPQAAARPVATTYRLLTLFAPPQNSPEGFRRGTALAVDPSGRVFLYDDRAERVTVYR